jgi:hypothetical protein
MFKHVSNDSTYKAWFITVKSETEYVTDIRNIQLYFCQPVDQRKLRTTMRKGNFSVPLPKTEQWGMPYINNQVRLHKPRGKTKLCKTFIACKATAIFICSAECVCLLDYRNKEDVRGLRQSIDLPLDIPYKPHITRSLSKQFRVSIIITGKTWVRLRISSD